MKKTIIALCALGCIFGANIKAKAISISNTGFETGDFYGWTPSGNAQVVSQKAAKSGTVYSPAGDFMLAITSGSANQYQVVSQEFTADFGDVLHGAAAFLSYDYMPYNDDAYVKIFQGSTLIATPWSNNVDIVGSYKDSLWQSWTWEAETTGTFTLEYGVRNLKDSGLSSVALFDSFAGTPVPEPTSIALGAMGLAGLLGVKRKRK